MQWVADLWWRLVRFGFRLLYNELAFTYDLVSKAVSLGAWRCWQNAAVRHIQHPGLILELAHGTGDLQIDLMRAGYNTIGYDLSPHMGRIARHKLQRQGLKAVFTQGEAQRLPFSDQAFDTVISTFPTDFIFASETLSEVWRVLAPGGRLIVVPSGVLLGGGAVRRFLEWLYAITGQRNEQDASVWPRITARFNAHGFETSLVQEKCIRQSVAFVLIADKKV
ncbi:MAG: hypothetical protein OHK0046_07170 [Anaerolineae bacterium]